VTESPSPLALTPTRYASEVLDFLAQEGFRPGLDDEGDVYFKFEGGTYVLVTSEEDASYFALYYLRFWSLDDPAERARAHEAAAQAHQRIRIGRITLLDDDVNASVQAYLPDGESWRSVLMRNLSGLQVLVKTFREQMHAQLEN
jgi:hypothetical protein